MRVRRVAHLCILRQSCACLFRFYSNSIPQEKFARFEAYERMLRSEVKYRFVIDMASLGK